MDRRSFLKSAAASGAATAAAAPAIERRVYRDDVKLSVIGFGGIVVVGMDQPSADRTVAQSVERGINYFDVAPSYWDGEAETKLGLALRPHRAHAFLACKTQKRDGAGAQQELDTSLRRLHTDHFDLYQFHAVSSLKDVEAILAPGGAAETFVKARQAGKVRYLGFSAHNEEAAVALMDGMKLDSVLFPVNFVCWEHGFGPRIMAEAKKRGLARLALKALAKTPWERGAQRGVPKCWYEPLQGGELARQALRFTLSEDVTAAIPPGDERIYGLALDLAAGFQPLGKQERAALLQQARHIAPIFKA
ncbi:MAG: aldo/keto reductase [Bryobacteraceae bacterium]|nr:aldo/keto reductase [Bryobacteraceae bacterium]